MTRTATTTPVRSFDWDGNKMQHRTLVCATHPGCEWITKHAWDRSVFYVKESVPECECPTGDLTVLG